MENIVLRENYLNNNSVSINHCVFSLIVTPLSVIQTKGDLTIQSSLFFHCETSGLDTIMIAGYGGTRSVIFNSWFNCPAHHYYLFVSESNSHIFQMNSIKTHREINTARGMIAGKFEEFSEINFSFLETNYIVTTENSLNIKRSSFSQIKMYDVNGNDNQITHIVDSTIISTSLQFSVIKTTFDNCCFDNFSYSLIKPEGHNTIVEANFPKDKTPSVIDEIILYTEAHEFKGKQSKEIVVSHYENLLINDCIFENIQTYSINLVASILNADIERCSISGCSGFLYTIMDTSNIVINQICFQKATSSADSVIIMRVKEIKLNKTEICRSSFQKSLRDYAIEIHIGDIHFVGYMHNVNDVNISDVECVSESILYLGYFSNVKRFIIKDNYNKKQYLLKTISRDSQSSIVEDILIENCTCVTMFNIFFFATFKNLILFDINADNIVITHYGKVTFIDCQINDEWANNNSLMTYCTRFVPPFVRDFNFKCFVTEKDFSYIWIYIGSAIGVMALFGICTFFIIRCAIDRRDIKNRMMLNSLVISDFG